MIGNGNPRKKPDYYVAWSLVGCRVKLINPLIIKGIDRDNAESQKDTFYQQDRRTHNIRVMSAFDLYCLCICFNMSRLLRIESLDTWYHVMNRGRRSEEIIFTDTDGEEFLNVLREADVIVPEDNQREVDEEPGLLPDSKLPFVQIVLNIFRGFAMIGTLPVMNTPSSICCQMLDIFIAQHLDDGRG